ncbi:MAG TPA: hypothetical protein VGD58_29510 [Herpetosiphonaceae bacterium]
MRDAPYLKRQPLALAQLSHSCIDVIISLPKGFDHMFGQYGKTFFQTMIVLGLLVPLAVMVWNPQIGAIAFLAGLTISGRCVRMLRTLQVEGSMQDQHATQAKTNQAQTIFVQLIDEDGNDLAPEIAEAKLAAAQLQAGPRDMVVGVRHKVR